MIKFKCIYCGQRILAKDDGAGKRGKCPKCNHLLVVPEYTKGRPAISPIKEPMPDQPKPYIPAWEAGSGFDENAAGEELTSLFKEGFGFLIPTYDKLSLFLMAITLIPLYLTNPQIIEQIRNQTRDLIHLFVTEITPFPEIFPYILLILLFLAAILYQVFLFDEKTDIKKKIMLDFAVLINTATGIFVGMYVIQNTIVHNWLLVFPICNIINGILMLLMFGFEIIDEDCISDRRVTLFRFFLGLTTVLGIFLVCNYVFKLYWAITFSICTVYTTSFDRALQSIFPGLIHMEDEQTSEV